MVEPIALPALDEDPPAGPNLELDALFGEMERAAKGKPESQYGNVIEPATPPDWTETARLCGALLERTRDLRVLAPLAVARLHLDGLVGFAAVVGAIRAQVEEGWEAVHPQLDPEDDNDPMQRANALLGLQHAVRVQRTLRELPLAGTARTGPVALVDIMVTHGQVEAEPGRERLGEASIRAAFAGTDAGRLAGAREAVAETLAHLKAIPAAFDAQAGAGSGPDYTDLVKLLREMQKELAAYEAVTPEAEGEADGDAGAEAVVAAESGPVRGGRGFASIQAIAALTTREDAMHALELAAGYFRSNEPSSPLPLLIDRAIRLAPLPFLEILRDMAPDGLVQAQIVAGTSDA